MIKLIILIVIKMVFAMISWLSIKANYPIVGIVFYVIGAVIMVAIWYIAIMMLLKNKRINKYLFLFVLGLIHLVLVLRYINLQYGIF